MNIAIIVPYVGNFGQNGFYNSQEIGLGKSLANLGNIVTIIKLHDKKLNSSIIKHEINNRLTTISLPSRKIGTHGLIKVKYLNALNINIMIVFSDIQLSVPRIHKWAIKNNIKIIDYVGVIKSNNNNICFSFISDILAKRNLKYFKKSIVYAKTPMVVDELMARGVKDINLMQVGLDLDLVKVIDNLDKENIRKEFDFGKDDIVIAFIGRLDYEKKPLELISLFNHLFNENHKFKLLIVGSGKLKDQMLNLIENFDIEKHIKYIEKIPNNEIWKIYCCSDIFINLCANEIFGMCILESMYYQCPVLALSAPGPNFIITDKEDGTILTELNKELFLNKIFETLEFSNVIALRAKQKVLNTFVWDKSVLKLEPILKK
jgi:glycosyltransferase involved in cell wall biosynthesis